MPFWLKLVKINGFLAPTCKLFGGFSCWLFGPGHQTFSEDKNNNRLRMATNLEGEENNSINDFNAILGSMAYIESRVFEYAIKILVAASKTAVKLAGDQPCIVPMEYTYATKLMSE